MARASALHAEGQGFDSLILHGIRKIRREIRRENTTKEVLKILEYKDMLGVHIIMVRFR